MRSVTAEPRVLPSKSHIAIDLRGVGPWGQSTIRSTCHYLKRLRSSTVLGNALRAPATSRRVLNLRRSWGGRSSLQLGERSEIVHQVPGVL
jgi:hypothetical protein